MRHGRGGARRAGALQSTATSAAGAQAHYGPAAAAAAARAPPAGGAATALRTRRAGLLEQMPPQPGPGPGPGLVGQVFPPCTSPALRHSVIFLRAAIGGDSGFGLRPVWILTTYLVVRPALYFARPPRIHLCNGDKWVSVKGFY